MTPNIPAKPVVAIVDDDPRVLESLEDLLEASGYAVRSYSSANALLVGGMFGWDILITDIGMPGMNGFELCDLITKARANVPVFFMTGRDELIQQARAKGVKGFFRKPFDARALVAALGKALRNSNDEGGNAD